MPDTIINEIEQIIENLIHIHPMLSKNLNRAIRLKTHLNPGSLFILGLLSRNEKLTMTEIGCKMSMPKPHVTAQIDKLIAEKMVERIFDVTDRRIINIRLTEKGRQDFISIKHDVSQELRTKLSHLDNQQLVNMLDATNTVRTILTEYLNDNTCNNKTN